MKLGEFGLKLRAGNREVGAIQSDGPTALFVNGRPSYTLYPAGWGFFLVCNDDMAVWAMTSGTRPVRFSDMETIIVDCPGFGTKTVIEKMTRVREAIAKRVSRAYGDTVVAAIDWWIESQSLENDNHSP